MTRLASLACVLSLVVGCASPMSTMRDENRRLTRTVGELREDRRLQDRKLRDLQRQLDELRAKVATTVIDTAVPSLPVEVAMPVAPASSTPSRVVGMTDDGYEIVYEGDAALGKVAVPESVEPVAPPPRARSYEPRTPARAARTARVAPRREPATPATRSDDATAEYRAAVDLVRGGSHADAIAAFRAFLAKHPRHDYADNAQYWLGEAHYAQKEYPRALVEFRAVIETYPRGNKVPDALLKVGYCYQALGQSEKARAVLEQVVNLYPNTEPAAIAAKRLETP